MPITLAEVLGTTAAGQIIIVVVLAVAGVIRTLLRYDSPITRAIARRIDDSERDS